VSGGVQSGLQGHIIGDRETLFRELERMQLEEMVAKWADSLYLADDQDFGSVPAFGFQVDANLKHAIDCGSGQRK
jgi:hypothetical protein